MTRPNNNKRLDIIMHLLERDGNLCQGTVKGKKCTHGFNSIEEMRVGHIDGNENNNPPDMSNYKLICNAANYDQWLEEQKASANQHARQEPVCVTSHVVGAVSEVFRSYVQKPASVPKHVHSIIPRDRTEIDDGADQNTPSESRSDTNWPRYALYFMLQVKLGHKFRATEAKDKFAQTLNIRHGTVKNHYYPTMRVYFQRDSHGQFLNVRQPDARPYLEEREIEHLIETCKQGTIKEPQNWQLMELYSSVLAKSPDELLEMFMDAPVMEPTGQ